MRFFDEIRRRNVHRVALAYVAGAWLLIQIGDAVFPAYGLPASALAVLITVLAIGFAPALVLSWVFEWTPEGLQRDAGESMRTTASANKRLDRIIIVTLVIAVGYFAVDKFVIDPARDSALVEAARKEGRAGAFIESYGDKSIAVLPFLNMSADPDQEYFADGISEELLNLLAEIPELRVISRSTAFTFKGGPIVVPEVAKKLNVSHILEGSVRRSGNKVRITAQLIDARTDTHLWSETYDRELDDIFVIQDEISARVVADLKLRLLGDSSRAEQIDPAAYELYLQARHILHTVNEARYDEAEEKLSSTLTAAPNYVPALRELGRLYERRRQETVNPMQNNAYKARIRELVTRMVEVAPDSSQANGWLGHIAWVWNGDYQAAAGHFERALLARSTNYDQINSISVFLAELGRLKEAEAVAKYVLDRDPACTLCISNMAFVLRSAGRHREAAEQLETIHEWRALTATTLWPLGVAWLVAGEPGKSLHYFDTMREMGGGSSDGDLGRLLALHDLGRQDEFEAEFARFRDANAHHPEGIARVYAWTGNKDEAFRWLERMVEQEGSQAASLVKTDLYAKLKTDPRWQAFLEKNGQTDEDMSRIVFNPVYPPEVEAALR
jgi:TolB-like protein